MSRMVDIDEAAARAIAARLREGGGGADDVAFLADLRGGRVSQRAVDQVQDAQRE